MNVSRRWLEAFLRRPLESKELIPKLAMLGMTVDAVEPLHPSLQPIVIGQVVELIAHPNADRLKICQVDVGNGDRRQVVTGAPNVELGGRYPFAAVGVTLPGGLTLEKRKLRGEVSEGMLCSARELALGEEHDGIMRLETDAAPGTPLLSALGLDDDRLVLDISAVRGDLLGHKGVARELAGGSGGWRLPDIPGGSPPAAVSPESRAPINRSERPVRTGGVEIVIEPGSAAARFTAAVVEGVTVGPSPEWLVRRLEGVGQRSINNVVDVTNYVMFEVGQPLHAFDGATIQGGRLAARLARPGEKLLTLDGAERTLGPTMTVVADGARAVGVAGIIGGRDTEVTEATRTVVLEAAWWDPAAIRATRRALGVVTEASQRFERGTDLWGLPDALRRAVEVLLAVAGGRLADVPADVWPEPVHPPRIFVRRSRVTQIVGLDLPLTEIERTLTAIGATVSPKPEEERLAVDVPGWRRDLTTEIDLVEEVARIHGYDRLPDTLRPFRPGLQTDAESELAATAVRDGMAAEGLYEVALLPIGPATSPDAVPVLNPVSADHGFLRERLLPGLLAEVERNWAIQVRDVRLFEIGTGFTAGPVGDRPKETIRLAAVITGSRWPGHFTDGGHVPDFDVWDAKGLFERAVSLANPAATVQVQSGELVATLPQGQIVGRAGPLSADAPPWAGSLFGLEIDLDPAPRGRTGFTNPPTVPASTRDLALVMPWSVPAAKVESEMRRLGGGLLESVDVVDEYRGKDSGSGSDSGGNGGTGIPANARSVAFRLVFRGKDRTLRDADVDQAVNRILGSLERQLGVTLRSS